MTTAVLALKEKSEQGKKPDIKHIPKQPGCYIFKNKQGLIIYIGKSKNLYNRVKQYFYTDRFPDYSKYASMAREVQEIEVVTTDTEINALILECQLIKKHKPRYNSQLINTPRYHYLRINTAQEYPTISIEDSIQGDRSNYYGGFYNIYDAQNTIELIGNIWQAPTCGKTVFTGKDKPCLNHHIGKCCAPCGRKIARAQYRQKIDEIIGCFNGNFDHILDRLNGEMESASIDYKYELAAKIRDNINGLQRLRRRLKSLCVYFENSNVYLFLRALGEQCYSLFYIKNGSVLNRIDFPNINEPSGALLAPFIAENRKAGDANENGAYLTTYILEIRASKYFVPAMDNISAMQMADKLRQAFKDFVKGRTNDLGGKVWI